MILDRIARTLHLPGSEAPRGDELYLRWVGRPVSAMLSASLTPGVSSA